MMIAFVRVVSVKPGKTAAAMAFAKDIAAYIQTGYGVDLEVLRPIGGNPQRVAWSGRYANLADFEAFNGKLMADAKYWEKVNTAAEYFVVGSFFDSMWQTV